MLNIAVCQAQKYSFSHYDIEDGLIQSQVNSLGIDNEHRLWIATYGGACRYDGKSFTAFTRQNGLPTNLVNAVFNDKAGHTWFGTQGGLAQLDGKKIINYAAPDSIKNKNTTQIIQDGSGNIWFIMGTRLYKFTGKGMQQQFVLQDTARIPVSCMAVDKQGRLYVSLYGKGVYYLEKGKWLNLVSFPADDMKLVIKKILFDKFNPHNIYLKSYQDIYTVKGHDMELYQSKLLADVKRPFYSLEQDAGGNLWIGTDNGAYYIKNDRVIHFTSRNGLTDNSIDYIFNDASNNLWLASQGNGLFKYEGDRFVTFDRTQGLPDNQVVMAVARDKDDHILLGIDGAGLMRYDGKGLSAFPIRPSKKEVNDIQCLYTAKNGAVWIGTVRNGIWRYDKNGFSMVKGSEPYIINGLSEDDNGTIWASTAQGCLYVKDNSLVRLDDLSSFTSSVLATGKDSVIVGTEDGILLVVNKKTVKPFKLEALRTSSIYCMIKYKGFIMIGTDDRGLFTWDMKSGRVKNYSLKDGLNSNTVYSLVKDEKGVIWAGTGRGVNSLTFNPKTADLDIIDNSASKNLILESNQNAAFYADHKVWIGTTKGVVIYNTNTATEHTLPPTIFIESARLMPQHTDKADRQDNELTNGAKIPYKQNHLAISFLGVYLKNPESVTYRYKLIGLDSAYSVPVKNNVVDYPSLPAGNYTFEVRAYTNDGLVSENAATFNFSVIPPFYQTISFRVVAIAFFVLLGIGLQSYRYRIKINRQEVIENMKREESMRIRQQTAEDFHDELGNKLTRITVLSEILDTKMSPDKPDQKKLLEQIKQNASSLYNGTKDILWALDPKSDNLYEILCHIKDFGKELFLDTQVEFEFNGIDDSLSAINLPMEYSRNLPMIYKELLNNILKHSGATYAAINLTHIQKNELNLLLIDNGKGFDKDEKRKGQGINNIITRTKRIGGQISFSSEKGSGTVVTLQIKIHQSV